MYFCIYIVGFLRMHAHLSSLNVSFMGLELVSIELDGWLVG